MKLAKETVEVLRNFATINNGIVITATQKGEPAILKTLSSNSTILAKAEVQESFPEEIPIYDLSKLINVITSFTSPVIEFNGSHMVISEEGAPMSLRFAYANPGLIHTAKREFIMPDVVLEFTVTEEKAGKLAKFGNILGAELLLISTKADDAKTFVATMMPASTPDVSVNSDRFTVELGPGMVSVNGTPKLYFNTESLKLLPGDYKVSIGFREVSGRRHYVSSWVRTDGKVTYYITLDQQSKIETSSLSSDKE